MIETTNEKIRTTMYIKKISQAEMAAKLGITLSTFNKKMKGKYDFTRTQFIQMAKILEVTTNDLI